MMVRFLKRHPSDVFTRSSTYVAAVRMVGGLPSPPASTSNRYTDPLAPPGDGVIIRFVLQGRIVGLLPWKPFANSARALWPVAFPAGNSPSAGRGGARPIPSPTPLATV